MLEVHSQETLNLVCIHNPVSLPICKTILSKARNQRTPRYDILIRHLLENMTSKLQMSTLGIPINKLVWTTTSMGRSSWIKRFYWQPTLCKPTHHSCPTNKIPSSLHSVLSNATIASSIFWHFAYKFKTEDPNAWNSNPQSIALHQISSPVSNPTTSYMPWGPPWKSSYRYQF